MILSTPIAYTVHWTHEQIFFMYVFKKKQEMLPSKIFYVSPEN